MIPSELGRRHRSRSWAAGSASRNCPGTTSDWTRDSVGDVCTSPPPRHTGAARRAGGRICEGGGAHAVAALDAAAELCDLRERPHTPLDPCAPIALCPFRLAALRLEDPSPRLPG